MSAADGGQPISLEAGAAVLVYTVGVSQALPRRPGIEAGMTEIVEIRLQNRLSEIQRLADAVEAFGIAHNFSSAAVFKINLVLDEVVTNIVEYGFDDKLPHEIIVVLTLAGDVVAAEVIDDGRAYDPTLTPDPDTTSPVDERPIGGLGVHFARTMMDRVEYRRVDRFNRLTLSRRAERDADAGFGAT